MPDPFPDVTMQALEAAETTLRKQARFVDGDLAELYLLTASHLEIDRKQAILLSKYVDCKLVAMS